jgi:hypothetical protein
VWKVHGKRLDGFSNDDHPSEDKPGSGKLFFKGQEVDLSKNRAKADLDFVGSAMPPEKGIQDGTARVVTDRERRTIARWIDLGCPIDLDYDPKNPAKRSFGWWLDDQRPTLTLTYPQPGKNAGLSRVVVGLYDYGTGLDDRSFRVVADRELDGVPAGTNMAGRFKPTSQGVWELKLSKPVAELATSTLTVSVADRQGNVTRIERRFWVGK